MATLGDKSRSNETVVKELKPVDRSKGFNREQSLRTLGGPPAPARTHSAILGMFGHVSAYLSLFSPVPACFGLFAPVLACFSLSWPVPASTQKTTNTQRQLLGSKCYGGIGLSEMHLSNRAFRRPGVRVVWTSYAQLGLAERRSRRLV